VKKTFTAAGLSGLLTRFPFNRSQPACLKAARGGSEPIAGAKVIRNYETFYKLL